MEGLAMTDESSALTRSALQFLADLSAALSRAAHVLRPTLLQLAEAISRLKSGPAAAEYELFLTQEGVSPTGARLNAAALVKIGDRLRAEQHHLRAMSSAFHRVAKAAGQS